jgi:glyoxylase-like metal-dependent hydrolase (beta-lactamase superfamily II)
VVGGTPVIDPAPLEAPWIHGRRRGAPDSDPPLQVRALDATTYVLRQSKSVTYEAPFLYLLVGAERALLLDTGAVEDRRRCDVRGAVDALLPDGVDLLVAHSHGHGDHVAGDGQFAGRPRTTVVGRDVESARAGWGFTDWPGEVVELDLGGRVLEVVGIPGHHPTSVAVYDAQTGSLLTGDSVYPGRLYAPDPEEHAASLDRLVDFAGRRSVQRVLGCHIEMRRAGGDFPLGARYQPDEAALPMSMADLVAVRDATLAAGGRPGVHRVGPALLWNGPCYPALARQVLRLLVGRARGVA